MMMNGQVAEGVQSGVASKLRIVIVSKCDHSYDHHGGRLNDRHCSKFKIYQFCGCSGNFPLRRSLEGFDRVLCM
jgi:hypothetical protein